MTLPENKTKIVCTIGPASESQEVLERMIKAGMNVARLNFSHGDFGSHKMVIHNIRAAALETGRRVAIMADLPGPKIRIGMLEKEPIEVKPNDAFILTSEKILGNGKRVSMSFDQLPQVVKPGDILYLDDGNIQFEVSRVEGNEVLCKVIVGGFIRSKKGLNLPGIDLGLKAFTERDHECLKFAMEQGVDAVSQSFVENENDIAAVRNAANAMGHNPFIIAKIERARARDNLEGILKEADGIMIARGDLGVEIPIEMISVAQKSLIYLTNLKGKPVITATQMLESMTTNRRPTRAEVTDVANAILDGTDCVMLSGESAAGKYPVDSVAMLARIAAVVEPHRPSHQVRKVLRKARRETEMDFRDLTALSVENALDRVIPATVIVPTLSGFTARRVTRFRLPVWITAVSPNEKTCQDLQFSYGVYPVYKREYPEDWQIFARQWLRLNKMDGRLVVLTEGPSPTHPEVNSRLEFIDIARE